MRLRRPGWLRRVSPESDLLESAWAIIANAGWRGEEKSPGWDDAAVRWRDDYFRWLDKVRPPRHD
jgi:hypothetical protein